MRIRFDKIDGIKRTYDWNRYLTLFGSIKYDVIHDKIRYVRSLKGSIIYLFLIFCKDQSWFLRFFAYRKKLYLQNVVILIKSVLNKDKSPYYYKIILVWNCSYQLDKK